MSRGLHRGARSDECGEAAPVQAFARAMAHHRAGRLAEAERAYAAIGPEHPDGADALHQRGLIAYQQGEHQAAAKLMRRAVELRPDRASYHCNLGLVLRAAGRSAEAKACQRRALEIDPHCAQAHFHLGMQAAAAGRDDEAIACYRRAVAIAPGFAQACHNLGNALGRQGDLAGAVDAYRQALGSEPGFGAAQMSLAGALYRQQLWDEALEAYRAVLSLEPADEVAQHMVAALGGETTEAAPSRYVAAVFDGCAARYERVLLEGLRYEAPARLRQALESVAGADARYERALDLGCGTGLAGRQIRPRCGWLSGVDLSAEMVAQARRSGIYDELAIADMVPYLEKAATRFDLTIAADVLVYCGVLGRCFDAAARCCAPQGLFALSTELSDEQDYLLQRSGRYAHSRGYIERMAARSGFAVRFYERAALRLENHRPVRGQLFVLQLS